MSPDELRDHQVATMRDNAERDRKSAAVCRRNADDFQAQADSARGTAARFDELAAGWDRTADALESGADLGDVKLVAEVRTAYGKAHDELAATRSLPVFGAAEVLSSTPLATAFGAPTPEVGGFEIDDVVNVCDLEHRDFGLRGTVVNTWSTGNITVLFDGGHTWSFRPSQLMLHATFAAQMDASEQPSAEADLSSTLPVPVDADEVPVQRSRGYWSTLADEYFAEQQAAKDAEAADDVMSASERFEHDQADEAAADYAASLEPGIEADL